MSSLVLLLLVGLGSPAIALLVARYLASDDIGRPMRRHREALLALRDLTRTGPRRP